MICKNYKEIKIRNPPILVRFKTKYKKNNKRGWHGFVNGIWDDVLRIKTVHGIPGIFQRSSTLLERFLLAIGLILAIYVFVFTTWKILYIYYHKPMRTVIAELNAPIYKFSFPEVNICNRNRFNWIRFNEAKEKFLRPEHFATPYEDLFRELVESYDSLRYGRFQNFRNISERYTRDQLSVLNYINLTSVAEVLAWRCDEMLTDCTWRNRTYDCCELFEPRRSTKGLCLAFNSVQTEEGARKRKQDPDYPRRTTGRGVRNGLTFRVHIKDGWHSPRSNKAYKGILFMLVEPDVWAYWHREIPTNSRVFISIATSLTCHNPNTRQYSPDIRKCIFEDEIDSVHFRSLEGHKYMFENCYVECEQAYLMEFCNCTMDLFFPPSRVYPPCRPSDFPCLYKHYKKTKSFERHGERKYVETSGTGMVCPCFFDCKSLVYQTDFRVEHIPEKFIDPNDTGLEMYVYFLWDTATIYETSAVYTRIDVMACVGGLAGLCIGCSLVGITEILYFILFDIPKRGVYALLTLKMFRPRRTTPSVEKLFIKRTAIKHKIRS
ncbi:pickpocket protein 19-like [Haematobia irritans]|uniref:pickpocket protein 19-like n=1 Tax=Haematobia irritans TaxID=7368 RepID=UPI003F4FFB94